jgi:hypothetical protein
VSEERPAAPVAPAAAPTPAPAPADPAADPRDTLDIRPKVLLFFDFA